MKIYGVLGNKQFIALRRNQCFGLGCGVKGFGKQLYLEIWIFFFIDNGNRLLFLRKGEKQLNFFLGNMNFRSVEDRLERGEIRLWGFGIKYGT